MDKEYEGKQEQMMMNEEGKSNKPRGRKQEHDQEAEKGEHRKQCKRKRTRDRTHEIEKDGVHKSQMKWKRT